MYFSELAHRHNVSRNQFVSHFTKQMENWRYSISIHRTVCTTFCIENLDIVPSNGFTMTFYGFFSPMCDETGRHFDTVLCSSQFYHTREKRSYFSMFHHFTNCLMDEICCVLDKMASTFHKNFENPSSEQVQR